LVLPCRPALAQSEHDNALDETKAARPASQQNPQDSARQHDNNIEPYRLDFSFNELEDGKKINSRRYSMNLTAGNSNEIKIGTRVPVESGTSQTAGSNTREQVAFQYMDVGTRIFASLRRRGDRLELQVISDISNLHAADTHDATQTHDRNEGWLPPIVRAINISGSTLLVTAKPIVIGSADDPNSNREFQLEVTATRLR